MDHAIRGILFDLGGTLMTFTGDWDEVQRRGAVQMAAFFRQRRIALDEEQLVHIFLAERQASFVRAIETQREVLGTECLRTALEQLSAPPAAFGLISEAIRIYFAPEEAAWQAFPDAKDTLRRLAAVRASDGKPAYRMGVLSNATDDAVIQRLVNRLGLRPWLSPVWTSAALGLRKPQRELFEALLARWQLPPESVVMVGDRLEIDILGAQQVGMRTVLITADDVPSNQLYRDAIVPDATIQRIGELPALLAAWSEGGQGIR
ncbi:MAG: HAD family hydrolase [Anaerolineae bacterium]|nr:HAD family hydrolase [Anaerolineae bacterium]MDW8070911.1 HAD family hydrolase [Anaerolineae bacterium]